MVSRSLVALAALAASVHASYSVIADPSKDVCAAIRPTVHVTVKVTVDPDDGHTIAKNVYTVHGKPSGKPAYVESVEADAVTWPTKHGGHGGYGWDNDEETQWDPVYSVKNGYDHYLGAADSTHATTSTKKVGYGVYSKTVSSTSSLHSKKGYGSYSEHDADSEWNKDSSLSQSARTHSGKKWSADQPWKTHAVASSAGPFNSFHFMNSSGLSTSSKRSSTSGSESSVSSGSTASKSSLVSASSSSSLSSASPSSSASTKVSFSSISSVFSSSSSGLSSVSSLSSSLSSSSTRSDSSSSSSSLSSSSSAESSSSDSSSSSSSVTLSATSSTSSDSSSSFSTFSSIISSFSSSSSVDSSSSSSSADSSSTSSSIDSSTSSDLSSSITSFTSSDISTSTSSTFPSSSSAVCVPDEQATCLTAADCCNPDPNLRCVVDRCLPCTPPTNRVLNPGFENGLDPWVPLFIGAGPIELGTQVSNTAQEGNSDFYAIFGGQIYADTRGVRLNQIIAVPDNTRVTCRAFAMQSRADAVPSSFSLTIDGVPCGDPLVLVGNQPYTPFGGDTTVTGDTHVLEVRMDASFSLAEEQIILYLDGVQVLPIDGGVITRPICPS